MKTALVAVVALASSLTQACADQPTSLLDGDGGSNSSGNANGGATDGAGGGVVADGGSGGSGGGVVQQPATFVVSVDGAAELELRDSAEVTVSVAANGYVGPVALSVEGAPSDVDAALGMATVTLTGSGSATVPLTLTTASSTQTGAFALTVVAAVPAGEKSADVALTIAPVLTITIPENLASFSSQPADTTAFGDYPTVIKALPGMSSENTITIKFYNADTVGHEIHADADAQGFGHGDQSIPPGSFDPVVRQVNSPGTYDYYPHDIGTSILGQITIE